MLPHCAHYACLTARAGNHSNRSCFLLLSGRRYRDPKRLFRVRNHTKLEGRTYKDSSSRPTEPAYTTAYIRTSTVWNVVYKEVGATVYIYSEGFNAANGWQPPDPEEDKGSPIGTVYFRGKVADALENDHGVCLSTGNLLREWCLQGRIPTDFEINHVLTFAFWGRGSRQGRLQLNKDFLWRIKS